MSDEEEDEYKRVSFAVEVQIIPDTGRVLREDWRNQFGNWGRFGDLPAVTEYCQKSGKIIHQAWYRGDVVSGPHREGDNPAQIHIDPETDVVLAEAYYKLGHFHRDGDHPALILRRCDGSVEECQYFQLGQLHRSPQLGPARIKYDENGDVLEVEFWMNSRRMRPPETAGKLDF